MAESGLRRLAERIQGCCLAAGLTVATAESCTGGRIGDALTDVPGSSAYFRGGVVAYADTVKVALLGVPQGVIARHGAVSAQAAGAMASGARDRLGADLAVAVTGIAGPSGGTPGKPVGLTYVAVADAAGVEIRRFGWTGDREANKDASAQAALELLLARVTAISAVAVTTSSAGPEADPDVGGDAG
jgi:PncC family amidohydrolase